MELTPQGTLAERLRAGGAGIPAFYTPTGVGHDGRRGRHPGALRRRGQRGEDQRAQGGAGLRRPPVRAGDRADRRLRAGAGRGRRPARQPGVPRVGAATSTRSAGMAGRITIAEVEELVEPGEIQPEHVHLPGVFVDRVVVVGTEGKGIE